MARLPFAGVAHVHHLHFAGPLGDFAVHCKSGYRSSIASSLFQRAGFRQVLNVTGGFDAWMAQKLSVETPERAATP